MRRYGVFERGGLMEPVIEPRAVSIHGDFGSAQAEAVDRDALAMTFHNWYVREVNEDGNPIYPWQSREEEDE